MNERYEDEAVSSMEGSENEIEEDKNQEGHKVLNNFLKAYKIQEFEKQVEFKSVTGGSYQEEEQAADIYLNKDQKIMLESTRCLIRGHSKTKLKWDLAIMVMAVYNCFVIPYTVAFEPSFMEEIYIRLLNNLIDICFMIDVVVTFRTTYIHQKTGNEIIVPRIIAFEYLKSRFLLDFLASFPFDLIGEMIFGSGNASMLSLISLLKLVRVLRLNRLIAVMKVEDEVKLSLKLFKLIFFLVMFLHCQAWTWYFIVTYDKVWMPPLDYVWVGTKFYEEDALYQYASSAYHSVLMLTGNDLGARNTVQLFFIAGAVTAGAIVNANIFGELAVILSSLNRKATLFQAKLDIANTAMKNLSLPEKLQVRVTGFLTYSKALLESQEELECFLRMVSPSLKERVLNHLFKEILSKNPVFASQESWVKYVTRKLETKILLPEYNIVTQGEKGEDLFIISKGEWNVFVTDHKSQREMVRVLKTGGIFGEVALLCKCNRTATVKTVLYSTIALLSKRDFDTVWRTFSGFQSKLKSGMKNYKDNLKSFVKLMISKVDYFTPCSDDTIEEISYYCEQIYSDKDKVIFRAGDPIDKIYFIVSGKVNILVNIQGNDIIVDSLYQGCSIGINGVLGDHWHNFTAKTTSNTSFYCISKDHLSSLLNSCEDLDKEVYKWKEYYEISGMPYVDFRYKFLN